METYVVSDNQPIAASFFGSGSWLTDFVTPDALEVQSLHRQLTQGLPYIQDRINQCWAWVANEVRYRPTVEAKIWVNGQSSYQKDYWQAPSLCIGSKVGNCANKAFLLASLLRVDMDVDKVWCVLGNLHNSSVGGHAWVEATIEGQNYIVEATRNDVPLIPAENAERYEAIHYFNDKQVRSVPGRTVLTPYHSCYSSWLKDYLDWSYINGGQHD